jgi:Uma2 family endonuclease
VFKLELNLPLEDSRTLGKDKTIILADMTWEDYLQLTDSNSSNCRLDYFEGIISIIAPSRNHERIAQIIICLINAYCRKYQLKYFAFGSSDIKNPPVAGKQPDASYCFENEKEIPDLAIEVVFSSGGVADLKKYQTLNVKEVWFWQQNQLKIYWLTDASYVLKSQSYVLNQLDSNLLDRFIQRGFNEDQLTIEAEFIEELER